MSIDAISIKPAGFPTTDGKMLRKLIRRMAQALKPEKIILFGSYASGEPTPDSDIDLLVVMETSAPPAERYLTVSRLLRPRPFPVDIIVKTPEEIHQALSQGDFFIRELFDEGLTLYEQER